jgi:hypothetical protein
MTKILNEKDDVYCCICDKYHEKTMFSNQLMLHDLIKYHSIFSNIFIKQVSQATVTETHVCDQVVQCVQNLNRVSSLQHHHHESRSSVVDVLLEDENTATHKTTVTHMNTTTKEVILDGKRPTFLQLFKDLFKLYLVFVCILLIVFIGALPIWRVERRNELKQNNSVTKWTYFNSVYFTITTVTSIGFGDMYPVTRSGKVYIIFFGFFSVIAITFLIEAVADTMIMGTSRTLFLFILVIKRICMRLVKLIFRRKTNAIALTEVTMTNNEIKIYKITNRGIIPVIIVFACLLCYMLITGAIIGSLEDWSYLNSFYFAFLVVGSVGYGDITPRSVSGRVFYCFFSLLGVGMLCMLMSYLRKHVFIHIRDYFMRLFNKVIDIIRQAYLNSQKKKSETLFNQIELDGSHPPINNVVVVTTANTT